MNALLPPADPESSSPRWAAVWDFGAVILGGAFLLLKTFSLAPTPTDEFIYLYMSRRIVEGAIPYRDFFFAHPPVHLVPGVILMGLFGFSLELARAIPSLSALAAGAAVYRIGRRAGGAEGLFSLAIFLFSFDLLRTSSHYTGALEATALLAWSLERALAGCPGVSGLLAAGSGLTAFYTLSPAGAIGAFLLLTGGGWRRFAASFLWLFLGVNALCVAAFGSAYWDPVVLYHFLKPEAGDAHTGAEPLAIAAGNAWLFVGAVAGAAFGLARGRARQASWTPVALGLLAALLHLIALFPLRRVFVYYYVPCFPGLAFAGGIGLAEAARVLWKSARQWGGWAAGSCVAGALVLSAPLLVGPALARQADDSAGRLGPQRYLWRDAPIPGSLNAVLRALFWREAASTIWSCSVTRYLQHESLRFETPARLSARVRALTREGSPVYGDSQMTPLVALLARRPIAMDEADTNLMRFASGITSARDVIERLKQEPPEAVIVHLGSGFYGIPEMQEWLAAEYRPVELHSDPVFGSYLLYTRAEAGGKPR